MEVGPRIAMRQADDLYRSRPQLREVEVDVDVPLGEGCDARMRICHHVLVGGLFREKAQHPPRDEFIVRGVVGRGIEVKCKRRLEETGVRRPQRFCRNQRIRAEVRELRVERRYGSGITYKPPQGLTEALRTEEGVFSRDVIVHPEFLDAPPGN